MALLPLKAKKFKQGHPTKNLGMFAHPPSQSAHRTRSAPKPHGIPIGPKNPDYKPKGRMKQNKRHDSATMRNQQGMDASDAKTETRTPTKAAKKSGGVSYPFFGKM